MSVKQLNDVFIDGRWQRAHSGAFLDVTNPTTEQVLASVVDADAIDVDSAVRSAARAFAEWRGIPATGRGALLVALAVEIERRSEEFAELITTENGTPITESRYAAVQASAHLRHVASIGPAVFDDDSRPNPMSAGHSIVVREPLGVAGLITPWNYPLSLIIVKLAPALIAGCTVVVKPAPETPLAARALMDAVAAVGFPDGVVNLVTGGTATGMALVEHPLVRKISFTGSTPAGRAIGETCGRLLRPVTLELGGKSPAVVLDDVNADVLASNILRVSMRNTGQTCKACTRLIVPVSRAAEITELVAHVIASAPIGDPMDPSTYFGPMVSQRHRDRVRGYLELGAQEGARAVVGGGLESPFSTGFFVEPTVFDRVGSSTRIAQEEIFGPVLVVLPYGSLDEAVSIANDSQYGLGGAVFGVDEDRAAAVARRIDSGNIGINQYGSNAAAPFSGHKDSGIGTEFGIEGLGSYLSYTSIHFGS
jgi:aldehyde dehydrogenase (NAD+)